MQTSLSRRQSRRMNGGRRRNGPGTARRAAVAIPVFLFGLFAFAGLAGFVGTVAAYNYFARDLTDPRALEDIGFAEESIIYDRTGRIELARFGSTRREVVAFDQIPPILLDATTAVEDKTFWTNTGFDPAGIAAAGLDALRGDARGASTITQQLVRQRLLQADLVQDPGRRYERKVKEIIQSIRLTQAFPGEDGKQRVITAYLNQNFYGSNYYGVLAAAKGYFGVESLDELTLAQAAILAGIPQSPSTYDLNRNAVQQEDGTLVVPDDATIVERRNYILDLMSQDRTPRSGTELTAAAFESAKEEPVVLRPDTETRWRAPHFVWAVRKELTVKLCGATAAAPAPNQTAEGGENEIATCDELERGGLRVTTTLDWEMQKLADRWVKAAAILPRIRSSTPEEYAERIGVEYEDWMQALTDKNVNNGALAAMDYQTGEVLAYVGSAEYYAATSAKPAFQPQYDVLADGWRQPGSAFKPFNYTTGLNDRTLTAATMFMDAATDFGNDFSPTNADNLERGPVRVRQALQFSLNIPSVKALQRNGVNHVFDVSRRAGMQFQTENPERDAGLSMALGTLEVHPIDLLTAYSTLANGGTRLGRTSILRVTDTAGADVIRPYQPPAGDPVFDAQAAYIMTDILAGNTNPDVNPYWGNFQVVDANGDARPAALKTGTNNDAKDLNAFGFLAPPTAEGRERGEYALAIGAWNGNSDNTEVSTPGNPVFSVDVTARVWERFIEQATAEWEINQFTDHRPQGIVEAEVDAFSGMLPGAFSEHTVTELFIDGTVPRDEDNTKVALQVQPETGRVWQNGCAGQPVTRGYLDFDHVESDIPVWNEFVRDWIARARRGPGVVGGPDDTRTSYFIDLNNQPFGQTWGAQWPPTETCSIAPTPSPTPPPTPEPTASPEPTPSPSPSPSPSPEPTLAPEPTPDATPEPPTPTPAP